MVRFDELAHMVNERVDPSKTDAEIYVGLEHLDTDSLKLRRWGQPSDVIGDKLQFRKGDIIFGRRRAYQRKLAVAEFDGICSAHAMVVRAKTKTVDPNFFPFLMRSDLFMQRAIDISVGSLSPTINWSTLRVQEFPLPPKNEQRRIADVLFASDDVFEFYRTATSDLRHLFDAAKAEYLGQSKANTMSAEFVQTTIGNSAEIEMGASPPGDSYNSDGKGFALLNGPTEFGERYPTAQQWTTKPSKFCKPGDILFCVRGSTTGRQNIADTVYCLGRGLAAVRGLEGISRTGYLRYILQLMEKRILEIARGAGSTFPNMNKKSIEEWPVFLPSLSDQDRIVSILDAVENQITSLSEHTKLSEYTKQQLVNSLIEGRHQIRG